MNKLQMRADRNTSPLFPKREKTQIQKFFTRTISEMIQEHRRGDINFNEFVTILARHDIKFYSPQEFKKMSKIFIHSMNSLPLKEPFQYIEMHSKQDISHHQVYQLSYNSLLIRVLNKKIHLGVGETVHTERVMLHSSDKCLRDFVILMKKRYGSEINWFKVVGGLTVSVSIQEAAFKQNIQQIMKHTIHNQCSQRLVQLFQQPKEKIITWNRFMNVVKTCIKRVSESLRAREKSIRPVRCHTESTTGDDNSFATIKSAFIQTAKSFQEGKNEFITKINDQKASPVENKAFFWSRCKTQPQQQFMMPLQMKRCMIHDRRIIANSYNGNQFGQTKDVNFSKMSSISFRTSVGGKKNRALRSWMVDFNIKTG